MTFETADDVLEHFGVKGMRWGVRNSKTSGRSSSGKKKKNFVQRHPAAIGAAAATGVIIAGVILSHRGGTRLPSGLSSGGSSKIARDALRSQNIMSKVIKSKGQTRVSNIPKATATVRKRVTKSAAGDLAKMRTEIAASIKAANVDLKTRDNALNIPVHARSYLTEWD